MSPLHEPDEQVPWGSRPVTLSICGAEADKIIAAAFGNQPNIGVVRCDRCGRWQDFEAPFTFGDIHQAALAAGWKREGGTDVCPTCVGH
jgi:hypothetical protein